MYRIEPTCRRQKRVFVLTISLALLSSSSHAALYQVTVAGDIVSSIGRPDEYDLAGADFQLIFTYDTEVPTTSPSGGGGVFAQSTFPFVEATYSFSNRPYGAADSSVSFGHNMIMHNEYREPRFHDGFIFPQGRFDGRTEFLGLVAGNGGGLDLGSNSFFAGTERVLRMPALSASDVAGVRDVNYVFFSTTNDANYNYGSAELVDIRAVPEPTTLLLTLIGALGLGFGSRRFSHAGHR